MPCGACGCACGEASREDAVAAPQLDLDDGRPGGRATDSTPAWRDPLKEWGERAGNRMIKFFVRGMLILLWVHLFNSMRSYAISYVGGDTWFSMFVVLAVAVPIAEIFCLVGHIMTIPLREPSALL